MDQYIGSHKLATYLHPGPSGPFLEMKSEPLRPPSPCTSALLQHNPSLIDLCTFNCLCQRIAESNASSNSSPYKPFLNPSDLLFCIQPLPSPSIVDYPKINSIPEATTSPISSAGDCSPNVSSNSSTPHSSPKLKHLIQENSPIDLCLNKDSSTSNHTRIVNDNHSTTEKKISGKSCEMNIKPLTLLSTMKSSHTSSPILHRLLTSPPKITDTSNSSSDPLDNENNKSPQYRPRFSPYYDADTKTRSHDTLHR